MNPDLVLEPTCDAAAVRGALRHIASTVHVVALSSPTGAFHATTATAVVSVCLDPPTLAVCLNRSNAISAHARDGARIAISALGRDQQEVAAGCAGGLPHEERIRFFAAPGPAGHRVVAGCTASFSGRCVRTVEVGTHLVLMIAIEEVATDGSPDPLVYLDGRYGGFSGVPH